MRQTVETHDTVDTVVVDALGGRPVAKTLALAVAWCRDEPWRVGELIGGLMGRKAFQFGRATDDTVGSWRQTPAGLEPAPPWRSARLSHEQLVLSAEGDRLVVQNLGRRAMQLWGEPVERARLRVGDVVEVRNQLVLLAVERPKVLPRGDTHPFGGPDADGILGESLAIWELRRQLAFVGRRAGHALILGQSGTGKELVARALHRRRGRGPWVSRNAATIPEGLVDAELFGNVRNYPNPGMADRPGLIGAADKGTLFLDEIGELPEAVQAHLLRVMDEGEYQRLGDTRTLRANVRIVAATNRAPSALKHDILARFPFRILVPGLEERKEDIPLIARALLLEIGRQEPDIADRFFEGGEPRVSPAFVRQLLTRPWSTHVRELKSHVWAALAASRGDEIDALVEAPVATPTAEPSYTEWVGRAAADLPAPVIQACLDAHNGRIEDAWRALGLDSRFVLSRLIRRHGLVVRRGPA